MRTTALLLLLTAPLSGWAQYSPESLLDKMADAVQSLNYEGTFVFIRGDKMDSMKIVHGHSEGGVRERLLSLTGEPREFIRNGGVLMCIWPRSNFVVIETSRAEHSIPATLPGNTRDLARHYDFELGNDDRVAGIVCREVAITPKDRLRYGYRLCIDPETGLLLRSKMLAADGESVESFMFADVQVRDSIPAEHFEATMSSDGYSQYTVPDSPDLPNPPNPEEFAGLEPDPSWYIKSMPTGFVVRENAKRMIAANREPVQHMVLSDGLASVSVFIARASSNQNWSEGSTRSGALHAYARELNEHQITVVGEVPGDTVKLIGQSIAYNEVASD